MKNNLQLRIPDGFISYGGSAPGELNAPRGIDIAPDGSIYVADSRKPSHSQFSQDGILINVWGTFANVLEGDAPGGTFNEPWDVAVRRMDLFLSPTPSITEFRNLTLPADLLKCGVFSPRDSTRKVSGDRAGSRLIRTGMSL